MINQTGLKKILALEVDNRQLLTYQLLFLGNRNLYAKQIEEHAFPLLSSYERIGKRMRSIIRAGKSAQEKAEQRKKELVKISEKAPSKGVVSLAF